MTLSQIYMIMYKNKYLEARIFTACTLKQPLQTLNKSAADDFENNYPKIWKLSTNERKHFE